MRYSVQTAFSPVMAINELNYNWLTCGLKVFCAVLQR
jgi:hypothetical protein